MYPMYTYLADFQLHSDDVAGIQYLYGEQEVGGLPGGGVPGSRRQAVHPPQALKQAAIWPCPGSSRRNWAGSGLGGCSHTVS